MDFKGYIISSLQMVSRGRGSHARTGIHSVDICIGYMMQDISR